MIEMAMQVIYGLTKALDPAAVSVSDFMRFDFTESFSYRDRVVTAVGRAIVSRRH